MKRNADAPLTTFADAVQSWRASLEAAGCPDRLDAETVPLSEALGRVPACILRTKHPSPTYRAAAMDGYAIESNDVRHASAEKPATLALEEDAVAIDTGGAIPDRFDAVVAHERVHVADGGIVISSPVSPGKNVRLPGEDVPPGVAIGWPGVPLRALDCAALIAGGCTTAEVVRKPRLAVIPTGDEIVAPGTPPKPGTVVESNSVMIAAEARTLGTEVAVFAIARDDEQLLEAVLREAIASADVVAVLAGSSRGRRDRGADAIARAGVVDVRGVATRPARPVVLGHAGSVPVVNLPGYPASCHFAFEAYVAPLLRRLGGYAETAARRARLAHAIETDGAADEWHAASVLTAPGSPRAIVVPLDEIGGSLYRLAQADARFHLKRGVAGFGRFAAVPWTAIGDSERATRSLFVGPYDPLIEELAALGGFRCRFTEDESGAALDQGLADAVGLIVRGGEMASLRSLAGAGRKVLPIGARSEGIARRAGTTATTDTKSGGATSTEPGEDPWAGAAAVAAGVRDHVRCSRYIAERFDLKFAEGRSALYAIVWEERPGHRFPWGIVLAAALSALEDAAPRLGWKNIGMPAEVLL